MYVEDVLSICVSGFRVSCSHSRREVPQLSFSLRVGQCTYLSFREIMKGVELFGFRAFVVVNPYSCAAHKS